MKSAQKGFTLVEVAISIVIISGLLTIGALLIPRYAAQFQETGSYDRMQRIHQALSAYAQKYNRIPCPAEPDSAIVAQPFGTERGSGVNGQNIGACATNATRHGIVPWRTLGLNYDDIFDSFGNMFTYRVSRTPTLAPVPATDFLNHWCRTNPKWNTGGFGNDPEKAAFCCGHSPNFALAGWIAQDTRVEGPFGPLPGSARNIPNYGGTIAEYATDGTGVPSSATLTNRFRPSFAAYALISHGQNGFGAYTDTGVQRQGTFLSPREADNANPNINISYVPDNTFDTPNAGDPGPGVRQSLKRSQMDDIVSWRTPFQTYGLVGRASCLEAR